MCKCQQSGFAGCRCGSHFDGDGAEWRPTRLSEATAAEHQAARRLAAKLLTEPGDAALADAERDQLTRKRAERLLTYCLANELPLTAATVRHYRAQLVATSADAPLSTGAKALMALPAVLLLVALTLVFTLTPRA